tara:strand:+ start:346 stop:513 length:168 start_codon:yes stop_codon:yes gene_type:complete
MRPEKIKLILAQDHSDEEAAGMTGITVEEVRKIRNPTPKPAPKAAPKKAAKSKKN